MITYKPPDKSLPDLFPIKTSCSQESYITKLVDNIYKILSSTLFNKSIIGISINSKKIKQTKQTLFYTLSYLRLTEYNDYKMNCAIGFRPEFYTKSWFSRTYFIPIIKHMIYHDLLEIIEEGTQSSKKVTKIKSSEKLINIFNIYEKEKIKIIPNDYNNFIEFRIDKKEVDPFKYFMDFDENKVMTFECDNIYFKKIYKTEIQIFKWSYYEEFLKNLYSYYRKCDYGYDRNLLNEYNKEIKYKVEHIKNNHRRRNSQKKYLKKINEIKINKYRVKPKQIFNNSLSYNGRIYNHFAEEIPKNIRKTITIDNTETTCIDFSSMHPAIIYYCEFGNFPKNSIYKDLENTYDIDNNLFWKIIKIITLYSLNATNEETSLYSIKDELIKYCTLSLKKWKFEKLRIPLKYHKKICSITFIRKIVNQIKNNMKWLYKHFYKNAGVKLMHIEYCIFRKIAESFYEKTHEYPISIHDGYVIKKFQTSILQNCINEECQKIFGDTLIFNIEY